MNNNIVSQEGVMSSGRSCLLILGMHRSGTSALARVLTLLGADAPQTLMPANVANETGYWESMSVFGLNEELLASAGSAWDDWQAFEPGWLASPKAGAFEARARAALEAEYGGSSFFVLKDPRICRIAPFWLGVLAAAGVRPLVLLPLRNPLEVAASLEKRDGFAPELGHLLWLRHVLAAEAASRGLPRFHCSYDQLMQDWPRLAARASQALDLAWPRAPERAAPEIDVFLAEKLRHHKEAPQRIADNPALSLWLRETYAILARWTVEGEDPADFATLDRIRAAFDEAAPAFAPLVAQGRADAGRTRAAEQAGAETQEALQEAQASLQEALSRAEAEHTGRSRAEAGLKAALAELAEQRAARQAAETGRDAARTEAAAEKAGRQQAEAALAARIEEIVALTRLMRAREAAARAGAAVATLLDRHGSRLLPRALRIRRQMAWMRQSGMFDAEWYGRAYPDVAAAGIDPLRHFIEHGAAEGRAPNAAAAGGHGENGIKTE